MFFSMLLNNIKINIRNKELIGWCIIFPIVLGTLFYAGFGSIYDIQSTDPVPAAIVYDSEEGTGSDYRAMIESVLGDIRYDDGTPMVECREASPEEADRLLDEKEISGYYVVHSLTDMELIIRSSNMKTSILSAILTGYNQNMDIVAKGLAKGLTEDEIRSAMTIGDYVKEQNLGGDSHDPYVAYFYNLIAMCCLMCIQTSLHIFPNIRASRSNLGKRHELSPGSQRVIMLASFLAATLVQICISQVTLFYLICVLKINFGGNTGLIILTTVIGTFMASTIGLAIGSLRLKQSVLESIALMITVGGGFLSGLMYGDIKWKFELDFPIINRINPASVLSDAFYHLNIDHGGKGYNYSLCYMLIVSIIFLTAGIIMSSKKSSKSL